MSSGSGNDTEIRNTAETNRAGLGVFFRSRTLRLLLFLVISYPFFKHAIVVPWIRGYEAGDFTIYYEAAERHSRGESPYPIQEIENLPQGSSSPIWGEYPYPPLLARLLVPLTPLPVLWAKRVYTGVCLLFFFVFVARYPLRSLFDSAAFWSALAILLGWGPFIYSIRLGQCELLAIPFIAFAWWCLGDTKSGDSSQKRSAVLFGTGILLGVSAMVRVTPVVMLPVLLVGGYWGLAAGFVTGALLSLILSGPMTSFTYFTKVLPTMTDVSGMRHCPAFHVLFLHLVDWWGPHSGDPPFWTAHADLIGTAASSLFYLLVLAWVFRFRNKLSPVHLMLIGCYLAPLLAGKNPHHYTLAVFPVLAATISLVSHHSHTVISESDRTSSSEDGLRLGRVPGWVYFLWVVFLIPDFYYWLPCKTLTDGISRFTGFPTNVVFILANVGSFLLILWILQTEHAISGSDSHDRVPASSSAAIENKGVNDVGKISADSNSAILRNSGSLRIPLVRQSRSGISEKGVSPRTVPRVAL